MSLSLNILNLLYFLPSFLSILLDPLFISDSSSFLERSFGISLNIVRSF